MSSGPAGEKGEGHEPASDEPDHLDHSAKYRTR